MAEPARSAPRRLTLLPPGLKSGGSWIASAPMDVQEEFLSNLSPNALASLPYLFDFWAHPHQLAPEGNWRSWVILGGRGAGKTRAGAEWVRAEVEGPEAGDAGRSSRVALVGETLEQVRNVMVFGDSGIIACSPPDRRPAWEESRRRLVWPNGAEAQAFSAHDPERLRGPQFDAAWCDELGKWRNAEATWDMLQFALRLGERPRQVITTTPRKLDILKAILDNATTVTTRARTEENAAFLAASFLEAVRARYDGTRLGRQELDGEFLADLDGALWSGETLDRAVRERDVTPGRVVVAVDPPVTGNANSDSCGIVVVGAATEGPPPRVAGGGARGRHGAPGEPDDVGAGGGGGVPCPRRGPDRGGGEPGRRPRGAGSLRQVDPLVPFRAVRASRGKGRPGRAGGRALRAGPGHPCAGARDASRRRWDR